LLSLFIMFYFILWGFGPQGGEYFNIRLYFVAPYWDISSKFSLKSLILYPGLPPWGLNIDRCIRPGRSQNEMKIEIFSCSPEASTKITNFSISSPCRLFPFFTVFCLKCICAYVHPAPNSSWHEHRWFVQQAG
jgi:hypothetical protein